MPSGSQTEDFPKVEARPLYKDTNVPKHSFTGVLTTERASPDAAANTKPLRNSSTLSPVLETCSTGQFNFVYGQATIPPMNFMGTRKGPNTNHEETNRVLTHSENMTYSSTRTHLPEPQLKFAKRLTEDLEHGPASKLVKNFTSTYPKTRKDSIHRQSERDRTYDEDDIQPHSDITCIDRVLDSTTQTPPSTRFHLLRSEIISNQTNGRQQRDQGASDTHNPEACTSDHEISISNEGELALAGESSNRQHEREQKTTNLTEASTAGHSTAQTQLEAIQPYNLHQLSSPTLDAVLFQIADVWYNREQANAAEQEEERQVWKAELLRALTDVNELRAHADATAEQNERLKLTITDQKAKLTCFNERLSNCKRFIDGLCLDMDVLKKANDRNRAQQDVREVWRVDLRDQLASLEEQLAVCTAASVDFKKKTMQQYREVVTQCEMSRASIVFLEQQLVEKTKLLTESHALCERLAQNEESHRLFLKEVIINEIQSRHDASDERYKTLLSAIGGLDQTSNIKSVLVEAVNAFNDTRHQQIAIHEQAMTLQEALKDQTKALVGLSSAAERENTRAESIQTWIASHQEASVALWKDELREQTDRLLENGATRDDIRELRREAGESHERLLSISAELTSAREDETAVQSQYNLLRAKVSSLEQQMASSEFELQEFRRLKPALSLKEKELEKSQAKLAEEGQRLISLSDANEGLLAELRDLQERFDEVSSSLPFIRSECDDLKKSHSDRIEAVEEEVTERARQFYAEQKFIADNELKMAVCNHEATLMQLEQLRKEFAVVEGELQQLKIKSERESARELLEKAEVRQQGGPSASAAESLSATPSRDQTQTRMNTTSVDRSIPLPFDRLQPQTKLEKLEAEKIALLRQLEQIQSFVVDMQRDKDRASEVDKCALQKEKIRAEKLRIEAMRADGEAKHQQSMCEEIRRRHEAAIAETKEYHKQEVEALRVRLTNTEARLQQKQEDDITFQSEVERSWDVEVQRYRTEIHDLSESLCNYQQQAQQYCSETERLKRQLDKLPRSHGDDESLSLNPKRELDVAHSRQSLDLYPSPAGHNDPKAQKTKDATILQALEADFSMPSSISTVQESQYLLVEDSQANSQASQRRRDSLCSLIDEVAEFARENEGTPQVDISAEALSEVQMARSDIQQSERMEANSGCVTTPIPENRTSGMNIPSLGEPQIMQYRDASKTPRPNSGSKRIQHGKRHINVRLNRTSFEEPSTGLMPAMHQFGDKKPAGGQPAKAQDLRSKATLTHTTSKNSILLNKYSAKAVREVETQLQPRTIRSKGRIDNFGPVRTPKRKDDGQIVSESDVHGKKTKFNADQNTKTQALGQSHELHARAGLNDSLKTSILEGKSSNRSASEQMRVQALRGRPSRLRKWSRKSTKKDKLMARFSQELLE